MSNIVDWLILFNRKERYYLIRQALGTFILGDEFRQALSEAIGVPIPDNTRTLMDYHLDWVYASVRLPQFFPNPVTVGGEVFDSPDFRMPDAPFPYSSTPTRRTSTSSLPSDRTRLTSCSSRPRVQQVGTTPSFGRRSTVCG
jgi:hypothetical protein